MKRPSSQSLLRLRELTLIFDPELTDADLLALSRGRGELEREVFMGDLLLDVRAELPPRGEGVNSREADRERETALSLRRAGENDLLRGGEEALSSARER